MRNRRDRAVNQRNISRKGAKAQRRKEAKKKQKFTAAKASNRPRDLLCAFAPLRETVFS
jgi:hypothetical protein